MKTHLLLLVVIFVFVTNTQQKIIEQKVPINFVFECINKLKYEKLFVGKCNLGPDFLNQTITELVTYLYSIDPNLTIDQLLREYLFKNYTNFFENKYYNNTFYLEAVEELKAQFDSIGESLETSISNVKTDNFFKAFKVSNMSLVIDEISEVTENEFYSLDLSSDEFEEVFLKYFCLTGYGFCQKSSDMFDLKLLDVWSNISLDAAFRKAIKNAYDFILKRALNNRDLYLNLTSEEKNNNDFVELLKEKGTKQVKVSSLHKFLDLTLIKQIVAFYDPNAETNVVFTRKTKTTTTTQTTTIRPKVIPVTAVSEAAIIAIPLGLVAIGIIAAIPFIVFGSFKRVRRNEIINRSTPVESFTMNSIQTITYTNGAISVEKF